MALKIKLKSFSAASGSPTTDDLEAGEIGINPTQQKIFVNNAGSIVELGSALDFAAVTKSIIPDTNNTYDLGSSTKRWKDIYLSSNSIDLAGATISSDGTGVINIAATGATLPEGSKAGTKKISVVSTGAGGTEQTAQVIPFFTAAGGLVTAVVNFNFNATIDDKYVFTGDNTFTLSDGSTLSDTGVTLFQF